jgi:ArsR family transcriptional regulator, arsenate/arsenite/antimonite-responsive transcriptional repressor
MTVTVLKNKPGVSAKSVRLTRARRTALLKALADPRRFQLLEHIAKAACPLGCTQAREAMPISAATLSHHVKELESAGLISVRRDGKFHYLALRPGVLDSLASLLAGLEKPPCGPR